MSQLILISLKVAQFHYCSTGIPQWIGCSSWNSPHTFPFFSNLDLSIVIAQLSTERVPFFQHILLLKRQCLELLANIITCVPNNFLKNANLLWLWSSHWVTRTIPRSCQKVHVESTLPLKQPGFELFRICDNSSVFVAFSYKLLYFAKVIYYVKVTPGSDSELGLPVNRHAQELASQLTA